MLPFTSTENVEPLANDTLPVFKMPGELPGATVPPLFTVKEFALLIVPLPPSVVPPVTVTFEVIEPFTNSLPASIVVLPV